MKKLLLLIFLLPMLACADWEEKIKRDKVAYNHFGLALDQNESILEALPNCEVLEDQSSHTHYCTDNAQFKYFLKFKENKSCNKGFERIPVDFWMADKPKELIDEINAKNDKLEHDFCLVRYTVRVVMTESDLQNKINEITQNYGPPSDHLQQVNRAKIDSSRILIEAKTLDEKYLWDPDERRNIVDPSWGEKSTNWYEGDRFLKIRVLRDRDEIILDKKTPTHAVVLFDVAFKGAERQNIFDWSIWFKWTFFILLPFLYLVITTEFTRKFMKASFQRERKQGVRYFENNFKTLKTMYLIPAGYQLFVNLGGLFAATFIMAMMAGGDGKKVSFCNLLTPGFCDATREISGNWTLLMVLAIAYTVQLIVLIYNAKRLGRRYL